MSVRLYTDIVFTDGQIDVMDSPVKKAGALETLARIEKAISTVLSEENFASEHAAFCNLLQQKAQIVRDRFMNKTSHLVIFSRIFGDVAKQEKAVEEACNRIHDLNQKQNNQAKHRGLQLAQEYGYKGKDLAKAQEYLAPLLHAVTIFAKNGFFPEKHSIYYPEKPFGILNEEAALDAEATLRNLKQAQFSNFERAQLNAALLHFVKKGFLEGVELLLLLGADPNARVVGEGGNTALHCVACEGNLEILTLLLKYKADINAVNNKGNPPLCGAIVNGKDKPVKETLGIVKLLLEAGADPNKSDYNGCAPLHWVADRGGHEIAALLLKHGAHINARVISGKTPLYFTVTTSNQSDAERESMLKLLLEAGADPNASALESFPLVGAAKRGQFGVVSLLLQYGAQVNALGEDGYTALAIAAREGKEEIVKLLFYHGADLTLLNDKGENALQVAKTDSIRKFLSSAKLPDQPCPNPQVFFPLPPNIGVPDAH